jgi:hypothetical protein
LSRLNKYILEKRNIQKIYFAHPRATYSKHGEAEALRMLNNAYPNHIVVNPNVNWIQGKVDDMGFDIFFKVIDTVEFVAFMPLKNGKVGNGTWRECEYADKKGKDIISVYPLHNSIKKVSFNSLEKLSPEETFGLIDPKERKKYKVYE